MIDTAEALTAFAAGVTHAPALALDTEFMREKTYRAELCLVQLAGDRDAVCIDPLALPDLSPLAPFLKDAGFLPGSRGYLKRATLEERKRQPSIPSPRSAVAEVDA